MHCFDLVQFGLVVKGHQSDIVFGSILDVRRLFARVGIDDAALGNFQIKNLRKLPLSDTVSIIVINRSKPHNKCLVMLCTTSLYMININNIYTAFAYCK